MVNGDCATTLHRAAWVVPVTAPPIANGAVLIQGERIAAVGDYPTLRRSPTSHAATVDHGCSAIVPALVNAHTHLELTPLSRSIPLPQPDFPSWLVRLLPLRAALDPHALSAGVLEGARQILAHGTWLHGDVTNGAAIGAAAGDLSRTFRHTFVEVLGFHCRDLEEALGPATMAALGNDRASGSALSLAAHSCYAASAELIVAAKAWCRARQRVFAIHAAEHEQEVEFLQTGGGFCRHLLEALGRWVDSWQPVARTPVAYLEDLGVLDEYTLLVHAVHLTPEDWQRVAARGAAVCFCPRSNRNLGVGRPAIDQALRYGIRAGLGTDSLASNHDLSVFAEAMHVLQDHPGVSPEDAFHLATAGGAGALWQTRFGSLGPGQEAALCAVRLPAGTGPRELFANLIDHGHKGEWEWLRPLLKRSDWAKSGS